MNVSGITGLVFFILLVGLAIFSELAVFVNIPAAIICLGGPAAIGIMSYGTRDFLRGVWALRVLFVRVPPEVIPSREVSVLRGLVGPVYASGLIGFAIGNILLLTVLDDPSMIGKGLADALLCPFYAVLLAEGLVRPAVRHIEHSTLGGGNQSQEVTVPEPVTQPGIAQ